MIIIKKEKNRTKQKQVGVGVGDEVGFKKVNVKSTFSISQHPCKVYLIDFKLTSLVT
jgi:hypothetical protein